jgi:Cation transport ATPase
MTCAACQSFIQRSLVSSDGVKDATVNLMMHNATVTFDPNLTSPSALLETVRGIGYDAALPLVHESVLEEQERHNDQQLREYKTLRLKAAISVGQASWQ